MSAPLLEISGLRAGYRRGLLGPWRRVLDGVSLRLLPGERLAVVGRSGCGKSTLLRVAAGLQGREAGELTIFGQALGTRPPLDRRPLRQVQILLQDPGAHLDPWRRVGEMMRRSARVHGHADPTAAAAEALAAVGLAGRAQAWGRHLSGGEARRVGVARLRLGRPRLIFADEPTGGIDAAQRHGLLALLLLPVAGPPPALLLVSHDLPLVARWCERVLVLQDGKVVEELAGPALAGGGQAEETRRLVRAVPAWKTDGAST